MPQDRLPLGTNQDYTLLAVVLSFMLGRCVLPHVTTTVDVTGTNLTNFVWSHTRCPLQLDHRPNGRRQFTHCGIDYGVIDRPDWLGLSGLGPARF